MGTLKGSSDPLLGFSQEPHFTHFFFPLEKEQSGSQPLANHEEHIVPKEVLLTLEQRKKILILYSSQNEACIVRIFYLIRGAKPSRI